MILTIIHLAKYLGVKVVCPSQISTLDILDAFFYYLETQEISSNVHLTQLAIDFVRHLNDPSRSVIYWKIPHALSTMVEVVDTTKVCVAMGRGNLICLEIREGSIKGEEHFAFNLDETYIYVNNIVDNYIQKKC